MDAKKIIGFFLSIMLIVSFSVPALFISTENVCAKQSSWEKEITIEPNGTFSKKIDIKNGYLAFKFEANRSINVYLIKKKFYDDFKSNGTIDDFYRKKGFQKKEKTESIEISSQSYLVFKNPSEHKVRGNVSLFYSSDSTTVLMGGLCFGVFMGILIIFYFARKKWKSWVRKKADDMFSEEEEGSQTSEKTESDSSQEKEEMLEKIDNYLD